MNRLPQLRIDILTALGGASVVRVSSPRPRKLARELRKELRMCDVKVKKDDRHGEVVAITWKTVT